MSDRSAIQWTDATWNPVVGCSPVSAGCANCYAVEAVRRVGELQGEGSAYRVLTVVQGNGRRGWSGGVEFFPDRLAQPLRWTRGRRIFVNSLSDLWHEGVETEWVDQVFAAMALSPQHAFQVLTKRTARMLAYLSDPQAKFRIANAKGRVLDQAGLKPGTARRSRVFGAAYRPLHADKRHWPLPNVWLGTSVEDQKAADERIPLLLQAPAAVRFLSCEPLLGLVDLSGRTVESVWIDQPYADTDPELGRIVGEDGWPIHWVIAGGESGPGARPMHPDWARSLRDQCQAAAVPFFYKQWGEWLPFELGVPDRPTPCHTFPDGVFVTRLGKHHTGRKLDGREWNEFPAANSATATAEGRTA